MFIISDNALKERVYSAFSSRTREFRQRLSFGEGVGENFSSSLSFYKGIKKIEISQIGNADNNGIVLGNCCSSSAVVEFYNPKSRYSYNGKTMFVECGIKLDDGEFYYIPCGYYKVEKPETDDDWHTVKITAYDDIDRMSEKWNTNFSMPTTSYLLIKELADKYELEINADSSTLSLLSQRTITESEAIELTAYKEREVIGFLVGCIGGDARINTTGKLHIGVYDFSNARDFEVSPDVQWQNGFKKTLEKAFVITSITSGVDDKVFTAGTGNGISFVNPIITEDEITAIRRNFLGKEFQPSSCEWRGNPCIECGDVISVSDDNGFVYSVIVARQDIDLTGGLSTITHCPSGDAEISFDSVDERTRKALNKQYTNLQQAIVDATNKINGALGGYYEVLDKDNDGNPDGWLIKEYEDGHGGLIRANKEGIGLSNDGGVTYRTAITYSGINADEIVTGKIKAELIDTSALVVGGGSYEDLDSLLNVIVDTTNSSITKVDVLYGKNKSTTTPPTSWSTNAPVWENGYYIWTKTQTTAGGVTSETQPVCITGAKGQTGPTGATGETGADGLGISKIEEQYYLSTSSTSATGGSWSTNQPEWVKNRYIWTRSKVTWENNTVTYTDEVLAKAINGANETANSANETANATELILGGLTAQQNNVTYINGAKILTGSVGAAQIAAGAITAEKVNAGAITTDKLNVGWNGNNCVGCPSSDWVNHNAKEKLTISSGGTNYLPQIKVTTSTYDGYSLIKSPYFFCPMGATVKISFDSYVKTTSSSSRYLEVTLEKKGETSGKVTINTKSDSANTLKSHSSSYVVQEGGYYCITFMSLGCYADSYITNFEVYVATKGEMIVNGRIKSVDGDTYFDLDTGEVALKSTSGSYVADFGSAHLNFKWTDYVTGCIEAYTNKGNYSQRRLMIYSPNMVEIGYGSTAEGAMGTGLMVDSTGVHIQGALDINNATDSRNITTRGTTYSGHTHIRTDSNDNELGTVKAGVGKVNSVYSASLELSKTINNSTVIQARLDVCDDSGYAAAQMYLEGTKGRSSPLAIGMKSNEYGDYSSYMWLNGNQIHPTSVEEHKTDIKTYDSSAVDLINSAVIYSFKYKPDGINAKTKYGLIIERECPEEVIDNSGDAISLYSMTSISWKAIQEMSEKIESLERAVNKNA